MPLKEKKMADENCKVDFNANDFLTKARREAGEELTSQMGDKKCSYDLPQLLQMTHALIITNQEIWERCKGHRDEDFYGCLTRVSLQQVCCQSVDSDRFIEVRIKPEINFRDVGAPPAPPRALLDIARAAGLEIPSDGKFEDLPDYYKLLKYSARFEDALLVPFLHMFMEHMELLQVFFGEIESWITVPHGHVTFLENLFDSKILVPEKLKTSYCNSTCQGGHPGKSPCYYCNQPFSVHNHHYCSYPRRMGSFKGYEPGKAQVLFRRPHTLGKMDLTFDLDSDQNHKKLQAFKDFILHCT